MNLIYFLTFFVLLYTQGYAADCAQMQSGTEIRIDKRGRSMEHFRHQDQDGLGICYATATSAQLQSVLPTHPEISYLQLAALQGTKTVHQKLQDDPNATELYVKKDGEEDKWKFAMDSGDTCQTIKNAQIEQLKNDKAFLCPKNKTNMEELIVKKGDADFMELRVFLEASKYMNQFNDAFKSSNHFSFNKSFGDLLSKKKNELEYSTCHKPTAGGIENIFHSVLPASLAYRDCFNPSYPRRNEYWCKMARTIAPDARQTTPYSITASELGGPLLLRLKNLLESSNKIFSIAQMKDDFKSALILESNVENYEIPYANEMSDQLAAKLTDEKLQSLVDEFNEIKNTGKSAKCVDRLMIDYLSSKQFIDDYMKSEVLCENQTLMQQASNVVLEYSRSGLKDLNSVFEFLKQNASLPYHQAMMSLNASDCTDADKITIPYNLKCDYHQLKPETKNSIDETIFNNLSHDKAVTISFCASILEKPKSSFIGDECGAHAVNIIGMRCIAGKYKYLVQNSWGIDYKAKNPAITTEPGTDKHWLDERTFSDSVLGITTLEL